MIARVGIGVAAFLVGGAVVAMATDQTAAPVAKPSLGETVYQAECAVCHQPNRAGSAPEYPSLIGVSKRFSDREMRETIVDGLPRMVAFPKLTDEQVAALILYLRTADEVRMKP